MVKSKMDENEKMSQTIVSRKRQEFYRCARYNMTMFTAESGRMAICHERCRAHGIIEPYRRNCFGNSTILQEGFPGRRAVLQQVVAGESGIRVRNRMAAGRKKWSG